MRYEGRGEGGKSSASGCNERCREQNRTERVRRLSGQDITKETRRIVVRRYEMKNRTPAGRAAVSPIALEKDSKEVETVSAATRSASND